jgi:hypothetical protein
MRNVSTANKKMPTTVSFKFGSHVVACVEVRNTGVGTHNNTVFRASTQATEYQMADHLKLATLYYVRLTSKYQ